MDSRPKTAVRRFGVFELDLEAEQLLKNGRTIRIQPQPFRLLCLLTSRPGSLVTREEIQAALWADDTFVDFEQGVNFAIKQVREALGDRAEDSLYVQTVPKRGYRFVAPIDAGPAPTPAPNLPAGPDAAANAPPADAIGPGLMSEDPQLQKALWTNIAELRLADNQRRRQQAILAVTLVCVVAVFVVLLLTRL